MEEEQRIERLFHGVMEYANRSSLTANDEHQLDMILDDISYYELHYIVPSNQPCTHKTCYHPTIVHVIISSESLLVRCKILMKLLHKYNLNLSHLISLSPNYNYDGHTYTSSSSSSPYIICSSSTIGLPTILEHLCSHGTTIDEMKLFINASLSASSRSTTISNSNSNSNSISSGSSSSSSGKSGNSNILNGSSGNNGNGVINQLQYSSQPAEYPSLLFRMVHSRVTPNTMIIPYLLAAATNVGVDWTILDRHNQSVYDIVNMVASITNNVSGSYNEIVHRNGSKIISVLKPFIEQYLVIVTQLLWALFNHITITTTTTTSSVSSTISIINDDVSTSITNMCSAHSGGIGSDLAAIVCGYIHIWPTLALPPSPVMIVSSSSSSVSL